VRGSIDELPFDDDSFDLVTATGVLEYSGVSRAVPEVARVLRPGGRIILSYPVRGTLYGTWLTRVYYPLARRVKKLLGYEGRRQIDGAPPVTPRGLFEQLAGAGLVPREVVPTTYLLIPAPLDELVPRAVESVGRGLESRRIAPRRLATQLVIAAEKTR
jgi:SAM-dependent methyltransferase